MSLTRLASERLQKYGEYEALAFEGRRYTNLDQERAACRLAHVLRRLGVGAGDRVMVMLLNCPDVNVVLKGGASATAEDVIAFCASRLARLKCPKEARFVDSLPKRP